MNVLTKCVSSADRSQKSESDHLVLSYRLFSAVMLEFETKSAFLPGQ